MRVRFAVLILAVALVGCSSVAPRATPAGPTAPGPPPSAPTTSPAGAARTDAPAPSTTTATFPTTVRLPPTTAHPPPPPLPGPRTLGLLVAPGLPGEGVWRPAVGARLGRGYGIYTTQLRAAPGLPPAGVAWVNPAATRIALYAGTAEPYGVWPRQGAVGPADQRMLLAAFNGGFRIYAYGTGWYDAGRTAVPMRDGAASLVIFANGTATVADWGRDAASGPDVAAVRQNLILLVDHGVAAPTAAVPSDWGAVLGGGSSTWRSGVGVTAGGDLVYVGGPSLDPASLARLLIAAGAVRAMELDINPEWVSFATFIHAGGVAGSGVVGATNLLGGMYFAPSHYLEPFSRDFFAVFAR